MSNGIFKFVQINMKHLLYYPFRPFFRNKHAMSSGKCMLQIWLNSDKTLCKLFNKNLVLLKERW